jgi:hypothetical protein
MTCIPSGDIIARLEVVEGKTQNISTVESDTTYISNTLDLTQTTIKGLNASDVNSTSTESLILGGNNGPNTYNSMFDNQSGSNLEILFAGQDNELVSPVDGIVTNVKFSTNDYSNNNNTFIILIATGSINGSTFIQTDYVSLPNSVITASSTFNFPVSLIIKAGDRVWVGYNTENTSKRITICGMNTKAGSSYFWSYLKS